MQLIAVSLKAIILNYISSTSRYANSSEKCRGTLLMFKCTIEKHALIFKVLFNVASLKYSELIKLPELFR